MSQFFDAFNFGGNIPGSIILQSRLSPPALPAGVTHNYSPSGLSSAAVLRLTCNAAGSSLSGLAAQQAGFLLEVQIVGGGDLTLLANNAGSSASNRFDIFADLTFLLESGFFLLYDDDLIWRVNP